MMAWEGRLPFCVSSTCPLPRNQGSLDSAEALATEKWTVLPTPAAEPYPVGAVEDPGPLH